MRTAQIGPDLRLISTRRHISTAEAYFYGGGVFLRGGVSLRRKCISMKEVNLKAIGLSLVWKKGTNARRR